MVSGYNSLALSRTWPTGCPALPCPERFLKDGCRKKERERVIADVWSQEFGAGWIISSQYPTNYWVSTTSRVLLLLLLLNNPLSPLHCSAVKSTSSPADYSPPIAAFITKFMMKQFCVLFPQWSGYQGQTCSRGRRIYTSCDCMNTTVIGHAVSLQWVFHVQVFDGMGWGWRIKMMMRLDADKKRPPDGDPSLAKDKYALLLLQ